MITFCNENKCIPDETVERTIGNGKQKSRTLAVIPNQVKEGPTAIRESGNVGHVLKGTCQNFLSFRDKLRN